MLMNNPALLTLNEVSVRIRASFSGQTLNALTFGLQVHEHWAVTGDSTETSAFLDLLSGDLSPHRGDVVRNYAAAGTPIAKVPARYRFRNRSNTTSLYYQQRYNSAGSADALLVREYLGNHPVTGHCAWSLERVVARLELKSLLNRELIKLSNGETRRLLLAAALLKNPLILLMDNPLTGLDVAKRADFGHLLQEIAGSGITMVISCQPLTIPAFFQNVGQIQGGEFRRTTRAELAENSELTAHPEIDTDLLKALLIPREPDGYDTIAELKQVNVSYGEKQILKDVNWKIRPGERWALLGPNGAGKSTLLSLINGDNPQAYANDITLFGRKRGTGESIWDIKKNTGFVSPELFQYFPSGSSCIQVVESGFYDTNGLFRPSDSRKAGIARRWMQLFGIADHAAEPFSRSPVHIQRFCLLARALVKCPPLLILDEPCQGLEPDQQEIFLKIIREICRNSAISMLYVTHYQSEIPAEINNLIRLREGVVYEEYS
jgi:molybdate transport system ATP-binding protein